MGPEALQPLYRAIDFLCTPQIVFFGTIAAFLCGLKFRRFLVRPPVAVVGASLVVLVFILALQHPDFVLLATRPDNLAIWLLLFATGFFLWVAFYQAVRNDERLRQGLHSSEYEVSQEKVFVWPYLLYLEAIIAAFCLVLLFYWSISVEAPLEQPANASVTPNPSKAPWYFLGLQEMLVYFDPWIAGVLLPAMIILGLMAIPYCDPNPEGVGYYTFEKRKWAIGIFLFGFLVLWLSLIMVGTFLRGPNWNFFGLFEHWDPNKVTPLNSVNLSEYIHEDLLGSALPAEWWKREWPGLVLIVLYFAVLPAVGFVLLKKTYRQLGFVRYSVLMLLGLCMLALPIKMLLRWTFNLKYVVSIPEHLFNI